MSENEIQKGADSPGVLTRAKKRRGGESEASTLNKVRILIHYVVFNVQFFSFF